MTLQETSKNIKYTVYTVSYQNMIDIWIETFHPDGHVLAIWDVKNHREWLEDSGLQVDHASIFDNKILTIDFDKFLDADLYMSIINNIENPPFTQLYSNGRLITDNIDSSY